MNTHVSHKLFSIVGLLVLAITVRIIHPAAAPFTSMSILAVPSDSNTVVYSVTRVYQQPKDSSPVVDVLSPGTHFNVLGYNDAGSFIAIAKEGQSSISGWIPTAQVTRNYIRGTSLSVSKGYALPNSTSSIANVLTPGQKVNVLGHSQDGSWLAIENPASIKSPLYWIARNDISLPAVVAKTISLTKIYTKPTTGSLITNVLDPTYQLTLISRTSDNRWFAADDFSSGRFVGWVMSSDLGNGTNRELLPIISAISYAPDDLQSSHLTDLGPNDAMAYRYTAMAKYYMQKSAGSSHLNDLGPNEAMAYRYTAMAKYYMQKSAGNSNQPAKTSPDQAAAQYPFSEPGINLTTLSPVDAMVFRYQALAYYYATHPNASR